MNTKRVQKLPVTQQAGMTLVELVVVITLIGIIGAVVASHLADTAARLKRRADTLNMENIIAILDNYRLEYNRYPPSLLALVEGPENANSGDFVPFAKEDDLLDVYGNPYQYIPETKARSYTLIGYGADGEKGGEGHDRDNVKKP